MEYKVTGDKVEGYEDGEKIFTDEPFDIDNPPLDMDEEEVAEIRRRLEDLDCTKRYFIASNILSTTNYHNIESDCWCSELSYGTGFKRRKYAEAIMELLGSDTNSIEEHEIEEVK